MKYEVNRSNFDLSKKLEYEGIPINGLRELITNTIYLENKIDSPKYSKITDYNKKLKKCNKDNIKIKKILFKIERLKSKIAKIYEVNYDNNL